MKLVPPIDVSTSAISEAEDEKNKRLIAHGSLASSVWSAITKTTRPLSTVGEMKLEPGAPLWLVQLAIALQNVDRSEYLAHIKTFNERVASEGRDRAIEQARSLASQFGLEQNDIFKAGRRSAVSSKYRDPATGMTWSGRSRVPAWLVGKDRVALSI